MDLYGDYSNVHALLADHGCSLLGPVGESSAPAQPAVTPLPAQGVGPQQSAPTPAPEPIFAGIQRALSENKGSGAGAGRRKRPREPSANAVARPAVAQPTKKATPPLNATPVSRPAQYQPAHVNSSSAPQVSAMQAPAMQAPAIQAPAIQVPPKIDLLLVPFDTATYNSMAAAGYSPKLRLSVPTSKSLNTVFNHLKKKWAGIGTERLACLSLCIVSGPSLPQARSAEGLLAILHSLRHDVLAQVCSSAKLELTYSFSSTIPRSFLSTSAPPTALPHAPAASTVNERVIPKQAPAPAKKVPRQPPVITTPFQMEPSRRDPPQQLQHVPSLLKVTSPVARQPSPAVTQAPPIISHTPPLVSNVPPVGSQSAHVVYQAPQAVSQIPQIVYQAPPVVQSQPQPEQTRSTVTVAQPPPEQPLISSQMAPIMSHTPPPVVSPPQPQPTSSTVVVRQEQSPPKLSSVTVAEPPPELTVLQKEQSEHTSLCVDTGSQVLELVVDGAMEGMEDDSLLGCLGEGGSPMLAMMESSPAGDNSAWRGSIGMEVVGDDGNCSFFAPFSSSGPCDGGAGDENASFTGFGALFETFKDRNSSRDEHALGPDLTGVMGGPPLTEHMQMEAVSAL